MFLFPAPRVVRRTCNRCEHLSFLFAWALAACIQSGCPDRSMRIACRSAVRSRTWGTGQSAASPAGPCRTECTGRRYGSPVNSPALAPCCSRFSRAWRAPELVCLQMGAALNRDPGLDIHADDISLPQKPPQARWRIVAPTRALRQVRPHSLPGALRYSKVMTGTQFATMRP